VSVGDARFGRRDNGLRARAYAAAGDVDPRVGEHLLDVLAADGIAAFLRPSSDLHPVTRSSTLPKRPTDRLYVDRDHVGTARDHLARLAREEGEAAEARTVASPVAGDDDATRADPQDDDGSFSEPTSDEVDRAFAEIVAGFGRTARGEPRRHIERVEPEPRPREPEPEPEPTAEQPSLLDALDTFGGGLPEDEDARFVPPEPPPVPRPSLPTALAVLGVVGGLVVFLKPSLLPFLNESLAMFIGFTGLVTGFGTLVWRLRSGDDDDADPDDGARV